MQKFAEKSVWVLLAAALLMAAAALPALAEQSAGGGKSHTLQAQPQAGKAPAVQNTTYHGNLKSKKFHAPNCRYYYCKNCRKVFKSRSAAIQAGYVPCKVCRP